MNVETFAFLTLPGTAAALQMFFNNTLVTFDCISYAGPVTTVTWWKNGVVISLNATYQQSKVLLNATSGIYRITLNVTAEADEIVGRYSCSVNNSRGRYIYLPVYNVLGETFTLAKIVTHSDAHCYEQCGIFPVSEGFLVCTYRDKQ